MALVFAFIAGLLTLINPCILPVLPLVLASALQSSRFGPLWLSLGLGTSVVVIGVLLTAFGRSLGLTEGMILNVSSVLMIVFGLILALPPLARKFGELMSPLASRSDRMISSSRGQFLGGLFLGGVWSPCIGPTLGAAFALASQREDLGWATLIMVAYAAGLVTVLVALAAVIRRLGRGSLARLRGIAHASHTVLGAAFVAIGLVTFFRLHHVAEAWLTDVMPDWLLNLSITY